MVGAQKDLSEGVNFKLRLPGKEEEKSGREQHHRQRTAYAKVFWWQRVWGIQRTEQSVKLE